MPKLESVLVVAAGGLGTTGLELDSPLHAKTPAPVIPRVPRALQRRVSVRSCFLLMAAAVAEQSLSSRTKMYHVELERDRRQAHKYSFCEVRQLLQLLTNVGGSSP